MVWMRAHRDALAEQRDLARTVDQPAAGVPAAWKPAITTAHSRRPRL